MTHRRDFGHVAGTLRVPSAGYLARQRPRNGNAAAARGACLLQGFTLIELVIVVLIMGIAAATAAPKFAHSLRQSQLDAACLRIKADLNLARQTAIGRSSSQSVQFTAGSGAYTLPGMTHPDHPSLTYSVNLSGEPYAATVSAVSFGGSSTIQFDRFGQPNAGGTITVTVGASTETVTVEATNGVVTIP
jgi:prepilin-type N-terminal cleavage/methylation domain-containing protein